MPHFQWKGIDLSGIVRSGLMLARSTNELRTLLLKKDIALLTCCPKKQFPLIQVIPLETKNIFFKQLPLLLRSGVFLDQALQLLIHQVKHSYFILVLKDILYDVQQGTMLSEALKKYPAVFDAITVQMVKAGQESGSMIEALIHISTYQEMIIAFRKKLYSALLMPLITCIFFLIVAAIVLMVIVPTFKILLYSTGKQLDSGTYCVLLMSDFVVSRWFPWLLAACSFSSLLVYFLVKKCVVLKEIMERCLLRTPLVGMGIRYTTYSYFFQSLAMLAKTGVPIVDALALAQSAVANKILREKIGLLTQAIAQGNSFAKALQVHKNIFSETATALLIVGQESNCLPLVFDHVGLLYKESLQRLLTMITTLVQPLLMIILGLLIGGLIFALYVPLFNLSSLAG